MGPLDVLEPKGMGGTPDGRVRFRGRYTGVVESGKAGLRDGGGAMYVVSVTVFVKPEFVEPFIEATMDNAANTRREPGNVRFDVGQAEEDPTRFLLYEAYRDKAGFTAHQQTEHYLRWKAKVADWMAQPRVGVRHHGVFFGDGRV
jgi:autoinducer 2-degrading protein